MGILTLESKIIVDIKTYGWIQEIRKPGPQPRLMLPVSTILDLINQGVNVKIPDKWVQEIFELLVAYNETAKQLGEKTADAAEAHFRKLFNQETEEIKRRIVNPFAPSPVRTTREKKTINVHVPDSLKRQGFGSSSGEAKRPAMHDILLPQKGEIIDKVRPSDLDNIALE